jgi:hypothetical protein
MLRRVACAVEDRTANIQSAFIPPRSSAAIKRELQLIHPAAVSVRLSARPSRTRRAKSLSTSSVRSQIGTFDEMNAQYVRALAKRLRA